MSLAQSIHRVLQGMGEVAVGDAVERLEKLRAQREAPPPPAEVAIAIAPAPRIYERQEMVCSTIMMCHLDTSRVAWRMAPDRAVTEFKVWFGCCHPVVVDFSDELLAAAPFEAQAIADLVSAISRCCFCVPRGNRRIW